MGKIVRMGIWPAFIFALLIALSWGRDEHASDSLADRAVEHFKVARAVDLINR